MTAGVLAHSVLPSFTQCSLRVLSTGHRKGKNVFSFSGLMVDEPLIYHHPVGLVPLGRGVLSRSKRSQMSLGKKEQGERADSRRFQGRRLVCAKARNIRGAAGNLVSCWWKGKCRRSSPVMSRGQSITGNLIPFKEIRF